MCAGTSDLSSAGRAKDCNVSCLTSLAACSIQADRKIGIGHGYWIVFFLTRTQTVYVLNGDDGTWAAVVQQLYYIK